MRKIYFSVLFLFIVFCAKNLCAQNNQDLSTNYQILSVFYNIPGKDQSNFDAVNFRYGWTNQTPYTIAIQFTNAGYSDQKIKFAIKDITSNQTILIDPIHNSYFATETLKANSNGAIWSGEVKDLKDLFALRVWDSNGNAFNQTPVSILNSWVQKPRKISTPDIINSPAPSPTVTAILTPTPTILQKTPTNTETIKIDSTKINGISGEKPTNTSTPARTPTLTKTPTFTYTPTATYTPTKSQTPAPVFSCIYTAIGDSYTGGEGASCPVSTFGYLVSETLKAWYPGISYEPDGCPGAMTDGWVTAVPEELNRFEKKDQLPLGYVMFQTGPGCFFAVNQDACPDCCKGASLSQGVSYSYAYQKNMDKIISEIYSVNPNVNLLVLGIPDTSGGAGHFAQPETYEAYRQRLFELKDKYPKMRIADLYTVMKGHSEYFQHAGDDKDHPNDMGQAIIAKTILDQFSYWPYRPTKH